MGGTMRIIKRASGIITLLLYRMEYSQGAVQSFSRKGNVRPKESE